MFVAIGRFLYRNAWAQAVVGGVAIFLSVLGFGEMKRRRGRMQERRRQEREEAEALAHQREEANDRIRSVENVRRDRGRYPDADSLPDDISRVLIRDHERG